MTTESLTIQEALAQGYEMCGTLDDEYYMQLEGLEDIFVSDCKERGKPLYLAEKKPIPIETGNADDIFENMLENSELAEGCWDNSNEFLNQYKEEMQSLLDKIKEESIKQKASQTYLLTDVLLK